MQMYYNQIDISESVDINKTNSSYECRICHNSYFFKINFQFQSNVCDGCHDLFQKPPSFHEIAIVSVKGNAYRIHFWSKGGAINMMKKSIDIINF